MANDSPTRPQIPEKVHAGAPIPPAAVPSIGRRGAPIPPPQQPPKTPPTKKA